jgi:hypothetical protein
MLIRHPRPELGRVNFLGVEFIDGTARVDELHLERAAALLQHGFIIEREDYLSGEGVFEPLPVAVEGDMKPKISRPRKRR